MAFTPPPIIWRDDDIWRETKLSVLEAVDDIFQRYGVTHTIAVQAAGLEARPDLVALIKQRRMDVQLHCWDHHDLTADGNARSDLSKAVIQIEVLFGQRPTLLFPPWNKTNDLVRAAAAKLGLTVRADKISLEAYIRAAGHVREDVVNFHHWEPNDVALLDEAFRLHERWR